MKPISREEYEKSEGLKVACSFRPFIDPKCSGHDEIIRDMGRAIDSAILRKNGDITIAKMEMLIARVKQTLTSLDYEKLTDYQAKCVLLLEKTVNL